MSYAVQLNGTSQYATSYWEPALSGAFTIEGWFYLPGVVGGSGGYLYINGSGANSYYTGIWIGAGSNHIYPRVGDGSANQTQDNTGFTFPLSAWHHFALVCSGSGGTLTSYLDGVQQSQVSIGAYTPMLFDSTSNFQFYIGSDSTHAVYTSLSFEDVRVWNAALSQATIQSWYTKRVTSTHPNWSSLIYYWECNEGTGTVCGNSASSNSNYYANLYGSPSWITGYPLDLPATPTLSSPANGATNQATSLTLSWGTALYATSYNLQVSTSSSFTSYVVNTTGLTNTSYSLSGISMGTSYYWRVQAVNAAGTSSWSSTWGFTTLSLVNYSYTSTGGVKGGGTGPWVTGHVYAGTGGVRTGGSASFSYVRVLANMVGAGGVKVGGYASTAVGRAQLGSGGVKVGGYALVGDVYRLTLENGGPGLQVNDLVRARKYDYDAQGNKMTLYEIYGVVLDTVIEGQVVVSVTSGASYLDQFGSSGIRFVRIGNTQDTTRQQSIALDGMSGRQTFRRGIASVVDWSDITKQNVIIGDMTGLIDPVYGDLSTVDALIRGNVIVDGKIITQPGSVLGGGYLQSATVLNDALQHSMKKFTYGGKFSAVDDTHIAWTGGALQFVGGATVTINAVTSLAVGSGLTYIYWTNQDLSNFHSTTNVGDLGDDTLLVATAHSAPYNGYRAVVIPVVGTDGVDAIFNSVYANAVTTAYLNANYVTATNIAATYATITNLNAVQAQVNSIDVSNYIQVGGAANDINNGTTLINGGKITANSITVNQLIAGALSGFTLDTGSGYPYSVQVGAGTITFLELATGITATLDFTSGSGLNIGTSNPNYTISVNGATIQPVSTWGAKTAIVDAQLSDYSLRTLTIDGVQVTVVVLN